jgi:hypothetical protein
MYTTGNIYIITAIAVIGGGLFGFDISSMSAIISTQPYLCYFNQGPDGPGFNNAQELLWAQVKHTRWNNGLHGRRVMAWRNHIGLFDRQNLVGIKQSELEPCAGKLLPFETFASF